MNERFIRCSECGMPHEDGLKLCPTTGKPVVRSSSAARGGTPFNLSLPTPAPVPSGYVPPPAPSSARAVRNGPNGGRPSVDFDLVGTLIGGKYRVREILGEGGMGTVFEALREGLGNLVAIKVLHPNQVHKKDSVQRFHHEARAAARIGHPNICEVYDFGSLPDGRPYLVMDRLTGTTLAERILSVGGLPFQEVLDTLTQVLSGLHAAHEKGIIHRDVKPENVFLSQRVGCPPIAKILDFGVSKVMAEHAQASSFSDVEVTRTGVVLGTPYYLAPEQARGERNLDARVDLYACGVMLYEALTGRRPFRAANYNALLIAILTTSPRPAREVRPDLPGGFGRILDKSIARDPSERFQTALEFQAALQPYSQNPLARRSVAPSRPPPRTSTGFPPAPPVLIPSRPPRPPSTPNVEEHSTSAEDLAAFLESASSDALPVVAFPVPPATPPPAPMPFPRVATLLPRDPPRVAPRPTSTAPPGLVPAAARPSSAPTSAAAPRPSAAPSPGASRGGRSAHRPGQNFDDQATEVDLPRQFVLSAAERAAKPRTSATASSPPKPSPNETAAPRRAAPVLGPPLRPPSNAPFADDSATEIMSAAIRSKLPDPTKKAETVRPAPPRPNPTRPPPRDG
jgi:serine/threonine-protein kinase